MSAGVESVPFPIDQALLEATQLLFVGRDPAAALARIEHQAAFVLYERAERRRAGLGRLRELGHGALLDAYLERAEHVSTLGSMLVADPAGQLPRMLTELGALTDQIRGVPGFEGFLRYPSLPDILALNYPDPVVWIVSVDAVGYALLLEPRPGSRLFTVPLPLLISGQAYAHALRAWYAYRQADPQAATTTIDEVARWCWQACMGPLQEVLREHLPSVSRLTVVPVGVMQLLPLHVAWSPNGDSRQYFCDSFCVTLAPNLRLVAADRPVATGTDAVAAFAPQANQPAQSLPTLPWSLPEARAVGSGPGDLVALDADATMQAFLDSIGVYRSVHFAGHALASITVPWASHLHFADGPATLTQIADLAAERASELAVLSCCTGALGSAARPSPGITIAGVLLAYSFHRVVASLWRVRDDYGAILAARFHHQLHQGSDSLLALTQTQRWLRDAPASEVADFAQSRGIDPRWIDATRTNIASWGAFVHVGPSR